MKAFNILDRDQKVHLNAMLEASAGTGKTFAIENIVVRLLIDHPHDKISITLEKILVVTFTRAATRDLKIRIRENLIKTLKILNECASSSSPDEEIPDYLSAHIELGRDSINLSRRRIEQALFSFDQAQIFTIHGFCWRMLRNFALEAGISLGATCGEDAPRMKSRLLQVVRDFIRTELIPEIYSHQQIKILLKMFKNDAEKLQIELWKAASKGLDIISTSSFLESFLKFQRMMSELKILYGFQADKIIEDFFKQAPAYRGLCNRSKQVHPEVFDKVSAFASLFDKDKWTHEEFDRLIEDGLFLVEALAPEMLAKGKFASSDHLHYPCLLDILTKKLGNLIHEARNENCIFARMASDCQKAILKYQDQEELIGFSELLSQMHKAASNPLFAAQVRDGFEAVVVDEFQDTDPMQWEIFRMLFADAAWPWNGCFYLVGDPKQSIYAFRQADIYTYLSAAEVVSRGACTTLDTNYRSQPSLVHALNILFDSLSNPFPLPKLNRSLPFRCVKAGKKENKPFYDGAAAVQFWMAAPLPGQKMTLQVYEESYFFPAIAEEILRLHRDDGLRFQQCAVLVADRFQADRLMRFFKSMGIDAASQKGVSLAESSAVHSIRELLQGIFNYRHLSSLKIALGGRIIGMTHDRIFALHDITNLQGVLEKCKLLRDILIEEGIASFLPLLLQSIWHPDGKSVMQRLVVQQGGIEFYREFQDIADVLIQEQFQKNLSVENLIHFLDEFEMLALNDDERMKVAISPDQDGVSVLTSHISKGLEFDVVFTLGLIKRSILNEALIPFQENLKIFLKAMPDPSHPDYKKYCEEIDAEKMRQLYVAFTRAKYRLYIPMTLGYNVKEAAFGTASPIEIFLARLKGQNEGQSGSDYHVLYENINACDGTVLENFVEKYSSEMSLAIFKEPFASRLTVAQSPFLPPLLLPPPIVCVPGSSRFVHSFTSLANARKHGIESSDKMLAVPHNLCPELKSKHTLPAGSATGVLLHRIFEALPFNEALNPLGEKALLPWIQSALKGTLLDGWQATAAEIAFQALTNPLPGVQPSFCLADVETKNIYRETEFLFNPDDLTFLLDPLKNPGFIKGIIDGFFEYEGKYYLLDWKSNWLGPTQEDYSLEALEMAMKQHDYFLQSKIYTMALKKYLKLFNRRPFYEIFGGSFYLFVRGIGPDTGIYYLPAEKTKEIL